MSEQPEALSLADYLDLPHVGQHRSAAELRRQHAEIERLREVGVGYSQQTMDAVVREREKLREVNAELLEALRLALSAHGRMLMSDPPQDAWKAQGVEAKARAAIARAEEVKP